ncbi:DNA damage-binding protein 1a, variant 2 [Entomophthora muscae]|nr:DNA damage-binding protein 1a, variant 2 [Entomophthora muscae]
MLLAVLYANNVMHRGLAFYRYDAQFKVLQRLQQYDVQQMDPTAYSLLALQGGAVVALAKERAILAKITSSKRPTLLHVGLPSLINVVCYSTLDPLRSFLLAGPQGTLQLLSAVSSPNEELPILHLVTLGTTVLASSLCYLDNHFVYIGSHYNNSQMVRLLLNSPPSIEVIEQYDSISPVLDLTGADFSTQGPGQVVTCSGNQETGSLHVLRSGAGYQELANLEISGIVGLWALPSALVTSFLQQTRILSFGEAGALEERVIPGFCHDLPTLAIASGDGWIVQVTRAGVFLVDPNVGLTDQWLAPTGCPVVAASVSHSHVAVGLPGGKLLLLQIASRQLSQIASTQLLHDIACLDISPIGTCHFCCVGLWTSYEVQVLSLPSLLTLAKQELPGEVVPLSLLQVEIGGVPRLFASMADGRVLFFKLDISNGQLLYPGSLAPGTCPTTLVPYVRDGQQFVLTAADRSSIIYPYRDTLVYAYINGRGPAGQACLLQGGEYDGTMAFADHLGGVSIGQVAQVQRLHVRSIPLDESPRRLVPMPSTSTLGVITCTVTLAGNEVASLRLFSTPEIEELANHSFQNNESVLSLACVSLPDYPDMYAVGTGLMEPDLDICQQGYVYLFQVTPNRKGLDFVARKDVRGAVHSVKSTGGQLVASVNGKVVLLALAPQRELRELSSSYGRIHVVDMDVMGECILVGDLMRSCQILHIKGEKLVEVARDADMRWVTAVHIFDKSTFIMADSKSNLVVFRQRERDHDMCHQLEVIGQYHLGDQVNRIASGSLVIPPGITSSMCQHSGQLLSSAAGQTTTHDKDGSFILEDIPFKPAVLGTVSGAIQLINPLPPRTFHLLLQLERNILHYIGGIGNVKHRVFRSFQDEKRTLEPKGFVDGDVIELFLKLEPQAQIEIIRGCSNQDRHIEFPPLLDVSGMAGASYHGLSHPPAKGESRSTEARGFPPREKFREETGREAYDDDNRLETHQPHPIPISHVSLIHLLNDISRLH